MTKLIKNEETFIIDANVRESHMNRVDVLEKAKGLLLLPNTEYATTKQVADFYGVGIEAIAQIVLNNREELVTDGFSQKTKDEIQGLVSCNKHETKIVNHRGYYCIVDGGTEIRMSFAKTNLFPRRAILRIGMLLRDSEVAKGVRTQLLNIEEKATSEAKVTDIDEEIQLQMAVNQALMTGDINALAHASEKLIEFKSRHITEIENKLQEQKTVIKTLAKEEVQYKNSGRILLKLVNRYSLVIHGTIGTNKGWQDLCSHLVNKLEKGINLKSRRTNARRSNPRASYISVIRPEEFKIIIPAMVGICTSSGVDVSDIMKDT
ncbi:ORF6N domain-containing protein [Bacillus mycoides]|uniref:ORF6N domain-containing protein n=1 Tax=Bacillus mycoides TaxID=1405 RepID=UPI00119E72C8|nr:ORF6N domain-containing protein [Bacillus mycoides]